MVRRPRGGKARSGRGLRVRSRMSEVVFRAVMTQDGIAVTTRSSACRESPCSRAPCRIGRCRVVDDGCRRARATVLDRSRDGLAVVAVSRLVEDGPTRSGPARTECGGDPRAAAARPHEPHADRRRGREHPHRPVPRRGHRRAARGAQRDDGHAPGARRAAQRRRLVAVADPAGARRARGTVREIPAPDVVVGDLVLLEAGISCPPMAASSAPRDCETQESALTGESAPVAKDAAVLDDPDAPLGDRANMLFQNTTLTRGTAAMIVTGTGMQTQMGRIAALLDRRRPREVAPAARAGRLTRVLALIAWGAVAVMIVLGLLRGESLQTVLLVGIAMAVSAIPSALTTFVQGMLAYGARRLAEHRAVVKNLSDVETLGATSAINSTRPAPSRQRDDRDASVRTGAVVLGRGGGYRKSGALRHAAGRSCPTSRASPTGSRSTAMRRCPTRVSSWATPRRRRSSCSRRRWGSGEAEESAACTPASPSAVRFRVQVHGHLPSRTARRRGGRVPRHDEGRAGRRHRPLRMDARRRASSRSRRTATSCWPPTRR